MNNKASVTSLESHRLHIAAQREFEEVFPKFDSTIFRGTLRVTDSSSATDQSEMITLRCYLERDPTGTKQSFFVGLRFSHFGLLTTLDLVSVPVVPGQDPIRRYAWRLGWLSLADSIDTQFGGRPIPSPLISAVGQLTIGTDGRLTFAQTETEHVTTMPPGVDVRSLTHAIASRFGLMTTPEQNGEYFIPLLDFLGEHGGTLEFYEQFVLWLHECRIRMTPELAEALYSMKAADHARIEGISPETAYLRELSRGLAAVIERIQAVQRTW